MTEPERVGESLMAKAAEIAARGRELGKVGPAPEAGDTEPEPGDRREARRAVWADLVPAVYGSPRLDHFVDDVRAPLAEWSSTVCDRGFVNLLITGPVGTGKTHAGYASMRAAVGMDLTVAAYNVAALLQDLRPSDDLEVEERARRARKRTEVADLLMLNDVGAERATEWTVERLAVIVDHRWETRRPTIITTNLPPAELGDLLGERAHSRFAEQVIAVRIAGPDRRKATP